MLKPENLTKGQVLLCKVLPTDNGSKVQLEFAELIPSAQSIIGMLNAADSRFNKNKPKPVRMWLSVERENAKEYFPELEEAIDKVDETNKEVNVSILNPTMDLLPIKILITEKTGAELVDEYAITESVSRKAQISYLTDNYLTTAKRAGKDGVFLTKDGSPIFRETSPVFGKADHKLIRYDGVADRLEEVVPSVELVPAVKIEKGELIND